MAASWFFVKASLFSSRRTGGDTTALCQLVSDHYSADRLVLEIVIEMKSRGAAVPASLASSLFQHHAYPGNLSLPESKICHKPTGYAFARALGLRTPETFYSGIPFEDIPTMSNVVIKPLHMSGARGVFLVKSDQEIIGLSACKQLTSWDQMRNHANRLMKNGIVEGNSWMVQEFICDAAGDLAMDLKIFVFYGRAALTLEIVRYPQLVYDFRDIDGRFIQCNIYRRTGVFKGPGVLKSEIDLAQQISLEVPAPFLRIDFLRGAKGLCLGEFTVIPFHTGQFPRDVDHRLGVMFQEAQARLTADLLAGKKFEVFNNITA